MKPEFALFFSSDAIILLRRARTGWNRIGSAALSADDLTAELTKLRREAESLTQEGAVHSKLIIPDEQIRYMSLQTGRIAATKRLQAARKALEGATPYAVSDLAFDISHDGKTTHVAAVARETLQEAEDFADQHGFGPVSFVAAPKDHPYRGEPFFGIAHGARGIDVEADGEVVVDKGPLPAELRAGAKARAKPIAPPVTTAPQPPAPASPVTAATAPDAPVTAPQADPAAQAKPAPAAFAAQTATPDGTPKAPAADGAPRADAASPLRTLPAAPPPLTAQAPAESRARLASLTSGADGAQVPLILMPDPLADAMGQDAGFDEGPVIGFSSRRRANGTEDDAHDGADVSKPDASPAAEVGNGTNPTAHPLTPEDIEAVAGDVAAAAAQATASGGSGQAAAQTTLLAAQKSQAAAKAAIPAAPTLKTPSLSGTTSAPPRRTETKGKAHPVAGPTEHLSAISPAKAVASGRGRRRGVMIAAFALLVALAAWALSQNLPDLWSDLRRADLVEGADPVPAPILTHAAPLTSGAPQSLSADNLQAEAFQLPEAAPLASGGMADHIAALSPEAPHAPDADLSLAHQSDPDTLSSSDVAVLEALGAPVIDEVAPVEGQDLIIAALPQPRSLAQAAAEEGDGAMGGLSGAALLPPHLSDPDLNDEALSDLAYDPEADADGGHYSDSGDLSLDGAPDGSTPEDANQQAASYAATGIWSAAPELGKPPHLIDFDRLYVASIDNTELSQDAVALPAATALDTDLGLASVRSPTAAGSAFALDDRGLVEATPDGTLNPDGIMVYAGRPAITPPASPDRPSAREQAQAEETARLALLSQIRPRLRPGDLAEQNERAQLGGASRIEMASKRPRLRPESLKSEEEESQPATRLAVATAPIPRDRPANFANLVDRARRASPAASGGASQGGSAAPAVAVSSGPTIPTSASVARQATQERALNLRDLNLIGVYGTPANRRALVRLPNGRYVKVKVGDKIDGGQIVAIGEGQIQYQKRGRNQTLSLPNG